MFYLCRTLPCLRPGRPRRFFQSLRRLCGPKITRARNARADTIDTHKDQQLSFSRSALQRRKTKISTSRIFNHSIRTMRAFVSMSKDGLAQAEPPRPDLPLLSCFFICPSVEDQPIFAGRALHRASRFSPNVRYILAGQVKLPISLLRNINCNYRACPED